MLSTVYNPQKSDRSMTSHRGWSSASWARGRTTSQAICRGSSRSPSASRLLGHCRTPRSRSPSSFSTMCAPSVSWVSGLPSGWRNRLRKWASKKCPNGPWPTSCSSAAIRARHST